MASQSTQTAGAVPNSTPTTATIAKNKDVETLLGTIRSHLSIYSASADSPLHTAWNDLYSTWWKLALPIQLQEDAKTAAQDTAPRNLLNWADWISKVMTEDELGSTLHGVFGDLWIAARDNRDGLQRRLIFLTQTLKLEQGKDA